MGPTQASAARLARLAAILLAALMMSASPPALRAAATGAPCAPNSGTSTISGTVTLSSVAAQSVQVAAYTTYGEQAGFAFTNASGVYQLNNLVAGQYILKFTPTSGAGALEWYNNQSSPLSATAVTVGSGSSVGGINVDLSPGGRISGTVAGAGAGPLQSAQVRVYDSTGSEVASASTDASGNYLTVPGLPPGSYRVRFEDANGFLGTYFNNRATLATADPVTVVAAATTSSINATLARGATISGRVTAAAGGAGVGSVSVSASGPNGFDSTFTDGSGNYTLTGLASGTYEVLARPTSPSSTLASASQSVTVTAPNTTSNVNIALAEGGKLTGRVTGPGGAALSSITVFVGSDDTGYQEYVSTNASGNYEARGLPSGRYYVLFRPSSIYIPEAYNDHPNFDIRDSVTVTAPNTTSGIDAQLTPGGSVSGTVTEAGTGTPIKDVFVEVLDADGQRVETAFTNASGVYQTPSTLPAGSYRVLFNADERFASCAFVSEYYSGALTLAGAAPVAVTAGANTPNISATMDRGSLVFGRVTAADTGGPITSGSVRFLDASGDTAGFGRITFLGGYHSETALPSGSYTVQFSDGEGGYVDEYYNDSPTRAGATPIMLIAPTDLTGIDAALAKGGLISGRVTDAATGLPFSDGYVQAFDSANNDVGSASIEDDGTYTIGDGLASGSYKVVVFPYGGSEVAAVGATISRIPTAFGGGFGVAGGDPVAVAAPSTTTNINIAVRRGTFLPMLGK